MTSLPFKTVLYPTFLVRLSTKRVRSLACANKTPLRAPCSLAMFVLPNPFAVKGKSKAILAGLLSVKPAGGLESAFFNRMRILTRPPD